MFNLDIRGAIKRAGFFSYEVAAALGISETAFSRKISRSELSQDEKSRVLCAIDKLIEMRKGDDFYTQADV